MTTSVDDPFGPIPRTSGGHFRLHLHAAIYRVIHYSRRALGLGGTTLEPLFERYPFLAEYFEELRWHLPEDISWGAANRWWKEQILTWERALPEHLPLRAASEQGCLPFSSRMALMVIGLADEDSRFGALITGLQQPTPSRRPTLGLVGRISSDTLREDAADPWTVCRPLLTAGLVEAMDQTIPRSEWVLRVPGLLWDAIRNEGDPSPAPLGELDPAPRLPQIEQLALPREFLVRLANVPALLASGKARVLAVRCPPGGNGLEVVGAVSRALGRTLLKVDGSQLAPNSAPSLIGPFAVLTNALPCLAFDLGPGEVAKLPPLGSYKGPIGLILGNEGGLDTDVGAMAITLTLPALGPELRERLWKQHIGQKQIQDLERITTSFRFGGSLIERVARLAVANAEIESRTSITLQDVGEASRTVNRQLLDSLATHIPATGSWSDLVTTPSTRDKLLELERRCRHRETLNGRLGQAFRAGHNHGVRALLTGGSGTGKTLAARILAASLGMDLYRVDLAAVVNKYIGETEKNLHRVLSRAEALDVVLLLDEGDSLLGQRTAVSSANDRYANLETNYLLQRFESYQGIVVVTTNLGDNIDTAFKRRMDVVVPFFLPQAEERLRILSLHLPSEHNIDWPFLERAALRCQLSGGQIRNVAQLAILNAMDEGRPPDAGHFLEALRSEYRKAGGLCPIEERREAVEGVTAFLDAFLRS